MATGGAIVVVARDASGSGPRPVSVAQGPGAGCSLDLGGVLGVVQWLSQPGLPLPNPIPLPAPQQL